VLVAWVVLCWDWEGWEQWLFVGLLVEGAGGGWVGVGAGFLAGDGFWGWGGGKEELRRRRVMLWQLCFGRRVSLCSGDGSGRASLEGMDLPVATQLRDELFVVFYFLLLACSCLFLNYLVAH